MTVYGTVYHEIETKETDPRVAVLAFRERFGCLPESVCLEDGSVIHVVGRCENTDTPILEGDVYEYWEDGLTVLVQKGVG